MPAAFTDALADAPSSVATAADPAELAAVRRALAEERDKTTRLRTTLGVFEKLMADEVRRQAERRDAATRSLAVARQWLDSLPGSAPAPEPQSSAAAAGGAAAAGTGAPAYAFARRGERDVAPTGGEETVTVHGQRMYLPNPAQRKQLFERLDYNGNGLLSLAEIDKAATELWPQFNHKPALMRAYRLADSDGDGLVSKREFSGLLRYILYFNELWDKFVRPQHTHTRPVTAARNG